MSLDLSADPVPLLGALLAAALLGALLAERARRAWCAARLRARMDRARRREALAEALLVRAGYTVLATQVTAPCPLWYDGERHEPGVRADYLVARRGRTYVAEAKSGPRATDPTERATRRQLLEYAVVYDVDGVLLVDTESGAVSTVEFPHLARARAAWPALGAGLVMGALAGGLVVLAVTRG